jgi:hypothetical protein
VSWRWGGEGGRGGGRGSATIRAAPGTRDCSFRYLQLRMLHRRFSTAQHGARRDVLLHRLRRWRRRIGGGGGEGWSSNQKLQSLLWNLNVKEVCVAEIQPFSGSVERDYALSPPPPPKGRDQKMWTVIPHRHPSFDTQFSTKYQ